MQLYTIQMARWRLAKARSIHLLDTTVKSGNPAFAPSWEMVLGSKSGQLSNEAYTQQYLALMRQSFLSNRGEWEALVQHEQLALACYCTTGAFCHRVILAPLVQKYLQSKGLTVEFCGEILP